MQGHGLIALLALVAVSACDSSETGGVLAPDSGISPQSNGGSNAAGTGGLGGSGRPGGSGNNAEDGGSDGGHTPPGNGGVGEHGGGTSGSGGGANGYGGSTNGSGVSTGGAGGSGGARDAGDGGFGGVDGGGLDSRVGALDADASASHEFAYVASRFGGVLVCSVDTTSGRLSRVGSAIDPTGTAVSIAVHSTQRFVYVADEHKHVDTYPIASDGTLPAQRTSSVDTPDTLIGIALDPKGRFAYALSQQGSAIYVFAVDPVTGALKGVGDPVVVGTAAIPAAPSYVAVDPTGHFVYASDSGIRGYAIDQTTGALTELTGSPFGSTGLPDGDVLLGGAIAIEPSGHFLYNVGLGLLNGFAIDSEGKLTLLAGSPFSHDVQSDPNAPNIAIEPRGEYGYATHFPLNDHVSGFRVDHATGALIEVPGSPLTGVSPYSIAADPSGRFVYVGIDGPEVGGYSLTRTNGALNEIDGSPFQFGGLESKIVFATVP